MTGAASLSAVEHWQGFGVESSCRAMGSLNFKLTTVTALTSQEEKCALLQGVSLASPSLWHIRKTKREDVVLYLKHVYVLHYPPSFARFARNVLVSTQLLAPVENKPLA